MSGKGCGVILRCPACDIQNIREGQLTEHLNDGQTDHALPICRIQGSYRHQESSAEFSHHMEKVRQVLKDAEGTASQETMTKDFMDTNLNKIFVTPEEDGSLLLDIRIFTGDQMQNTWEG